MRFCVLLSATLIAPVLAQDCLINPPTGVSLGSGPDVVLPDAATSPAQPIGFSFPFAGSSYTDFRVTDHGVIYLSNSGLPAAPTGGQVLYNPTTANFIANEPKICILYSDTIAPDPTGTIWVDSSPTQCTIRWDDVQSFGIPTPTFRMKAVLFPSGQIEFTWNADVTNNSTFAPPANEAIVGVTPGGAAILPAASDLSTSGATTDSTLFERFPVANSFDMQTSVMQLFPTGTGWAWVTGPNLACAANNRYGVGCGGSADSIYEEFDNGSNAFDLTGSSIQWLRSGNGYVVLNATGAFVTPTAAAQAVAPGQLDAQAQFTLSSPMPIAGGTTTTINVTTKGLVELSGPPAAGVDFSPSVDELLNNPNTCFYCWHDFDQTGQGGITFEEIAGIAYVTWNNVESFSATGNNTLQFQLDLVSGNVTLVVVSATAITATTNTDPTVVGYSVGGPSGDPGARNLGSIAGAVALSDQFVPNLGLATVGGLPTLGNSLFAYELSNIPALVPIGFLFFGSSVVNPGLDLTFLGMPGCFGYTNANLVSASVTPLAGVGTLALPIPSSTGLVGVSFSTQGIAFSLVTPLNLISSNGVLTRIGN
jgi:hypothetical protein